MQPQFSGNKFQKIVYLNEADMQKNVYKKSDWITAG